jgi:hypothetical protein
MLTLAVGARSARVVNLPNIAIRVAGIVRDVNFICLFMMN